MIFKANDVPNSNDKNGTVDTKAWNMQLNDYKRINSTGQKITLACQSDKVCRIFHLLVLLYEVIYYVNLHQSRR